MNWIESHPYKSALIFGTITSLLGVLVVSIQKNTFFPEAIVYTFPFSFAVCFLYAFLSDMSEKITPWRNKK